MLTRIIAVCFTFTSAAALAQTPPKEPPQLAPKAQAAQSAACAHANTQTTVGQGGDVKVPTPENKTLSQKHALLRSETLRIPVLDEARIRPARGADDNGHDLTHDRIRRPNGPGSV